MWITFPIGIEKGPMPPGSLVAGVDSSTQATKVVIVDADSGGGRRSRHTRGTR